MTDQFFFPSKLLRLVDIGVIVCFHSYRKTKASVQTWCKHLFWLIQIYVDEFNQHSQLRDLNYLLYMLDQTHRHVAEWAVCWRFAINTVNHISYSSSN